MFLRPASLSVLVASMLVLWVGYTAQAQTEGGEIEDLEITIGKNRKLTLPEVLPDPSRAPLPIKPIPLPKQKFNYVEYNVKLPDKEPVIKLQAMKPEPAQNYPALNIRGGLAIPLATYAEILYRSKVQKNYYWGLHGKHFNLFRGPERKVASGYGENSLKAYTTYFTDAVTLDGALEYRRDIFNYYGIPKEQERKEDSVRQFYQFIKAQLALKQNQKTGPLGWKAGLNFSNMTDAYKAREFLLDLGTDLSYDLDSVSSIVTNVSALISRRTDSSELSRTAFWLRPRYVRQMGDLKVQVGANIAIENDTFTNVNRFHIYPDIRASLSLIPKVLTAHAAVTGDLDARTLQSHVGINPWLGPNVALAHTSRDLDINGGIIATPVKGLTLTADVAVRQLRNLPLYVNSVSDSSRFDILYARGTTGQFMAQASVAWQATDQWAVQGNVQFNNYQLRDSLQPFHLPLLRIGGLVSYTLNDQWKLAARADYQGDLKGRTVMTQETINVPGMLNLGLRADYKINQKFGAFVDVDNLLNQQNQRYLYYPTRGLLFMLGASYTLPGK